MSETLKQFLFCAKAGTLPEILKQSHDRVAATYNSFQSYLEKHESIDIYGATTGPGHQDSVSIKGLEVARAQRDLINSHSIGSNGTYSEFSVRCMGYAKAYSIAAGGALISEELYSHICRIIVHPQFNPSVPRSSSYSCGDVIPAAHWAKSLLEFEPDVINLKSAEGMALINGAFVHLGLTISVLPLLKRVWSMYLVASRQNAYLCQANAKIFNYRHFSEKTNTGDAVRYVSELLKSSDVTVPQAPVSIRSLPQVLDAFLVSCGWLTSELGQHLFLTSENPQMLPKLGVVGGELEPHPQGTFMLPSVALATSASIDAVLLALWSVVSRTSFLLSGKVPHIPQDARSSGDEFGFIQWPKILRAILEDARTTASRRVFVSGGSTSYGLEDLWSHGVSTSELLNNLLIKAEYMLSYELLLLEKISLKCMGKSLGICSEPAENCTDSVENMVSSIKYSFVNRDAVPERLFPV